MREGLNGFQEQPKTERPVRSLGQWIPPENRRPEVLGTVGGSRVLRWLLGTCFSLVIFPGSQVLACHGCPVRKGLLDAHSTQEHIQGSDKSCQEESWMTLLQPLFIHPKCDRQGRLFKVPTGKANETAWFFLWGGASVDPLLSQTQRQC